MTAEDRKRALALSWLFAEDIAVALDVGPAELGREWLDYAEAAAMAVCATGELERQATTGAVIYTMARLP